jgi:hypothetical protein
MLPLGIVWVFLTGFAVVVRSWARTTDGSAQTLLTWGAVVVGATAALYLLAPLFGDRDDDPGDDQPGPQVDADPEVKTPEVV